jgi:hypothetical protein
MVRRLADDNRIAFAPDEARVNVNLGTQVYKLAMRHQYRYNSQLNLCHTVKRWFSEGEDDFDVGCIGHHHDPAVESFTRYGLKRYACRPGAYQVMSSHSRQYGYNSVRPTCPSFILYPDRREIVGFDDINAAVRTLKTERNVAFAKAMNEHRPRKAAPKHGNKTAKRPRSKADKRK